MIDKYEEIQKFLENLPEQYNILEEGIDIQIQEEYLDYSHTFDQGELTEKETLNLSRILFESKSQLDAKKKVLTLLAHLGTVLAFRQIEKYYKNPDKDLKQWTALALQECKMFLENSLTDNSIGFVSSGLGGIKDRLRYYFLILPLTEESFTQIQKNIIRNEFPIVCKSLNSIMESIELSDSFVGLTILVPLDGAVGAVIETGINKCNELGDFVFEHYYVTNQNIPDQSEKNEIIEIVRND